MKLNLETVSISSILREVIELYQYVAEERSVSVEAELPSPLTTEIDLARMRQVFANLLDNAIKYSRSGGRVTVRARSRPGEIVVTVEDRGIGIPESETHRIFERLYRGDKSRGARGLGLGLSLVKAVVEAHHGTVEVVSTPDQGSSFKVRLPAPTNAEAL